MLFSKDGPKPWHTHSGDSRLDAQIAEVVAAKQRGLSTSEYVEKVKEEQHENAEAKVDTEQHQVKA